MATSHSDVRSLVDRFDTQMFRAAVAGGGNGTSSFPRHGAAEPVRTRVRSRDRFGDRRSRTAGPIIDRAQPSGHMESAEWLDALTAVSERVATLERLQRDNAQALGAHHEAAIRSRASITDIQEDIVKYKEYVETTFRQIDGHVNKKFQIVEQVLSGTINDQFNEHEQKVTLLQVSFDSLMSVVQSGRMNLPQEFNLTPMEHPLPAVPVTPTGSTTALPAARVDPFSLQDPWGRANTNPLRSTHPQASVEQTLPPAVPASFAPGGVTFQSPFETAGNNVYTPPTRPAFVSPPSDGGHAPGQPTAGPFQQYGQAPTIAHYGAQQPYSAVGGGGPGHYAQGGIGHVQTNVGTGYFEINYKPNDSLRKFDGDSSKYKMWNSRLKDHLARSNGDWKTVLCSLETAEFPITREWLSTSHIHGNSAWDLSTKLETFISTWVSDSLYGRRVQMAGSKAQEGNGFEIWRQLYHEHHGGANAVQLGGMRRLQEWPKCTSIGNLNQHLDAWLECLETHNQELLAAPNVLRTMILGVIPTEYEDEILVRPEVITHRDIILFCKNRTTYKRQKALAEITRRSTQGRINSLAEDREDVMEESTQLMPTWASAIVNSIAKLNSSMPPPSAHTAARPSRVAGDDIAAVQQQARKPMANGRKAFNLKFRFAGCWHCGEEGHSRKENPARQIKGCAKFEALKKRNDGRPPAGYKGAYEKARDAAWEKFRATGPKKLINNLEDTDDDDDSDLSYDDDGSMFALRSTTAPSPKSFVHRSPFEDLDNEEAEMSDDLIEHFSKWAKVKAKRQSHKHIQVSSLQDLDEHIALNPKVFATSQLNTKKLQQSMRNMPRGLDLEDDEVLALVDTGSSIHAADADVHFPDYSSKVRRSSHKKSAGTTTAGGHRLENLGRFNVSADADGQTVRIPFNHMKVKLPILSVRQMMSKGGQLTLTEHGGKITNATTHQSINFVIHDDLWYVKLKVNKPPTNDGRQPSLPFGRQGSA